MADNLLRNGPVMTERGSVTLERIVGALRARQRRRSLVFLDGREADHDLMAAIGAFARYTIPLRDYARRRVDIDYGSQFYRHLIVKCPRCFTIA
jgi:hypothetical protein